MRILFALHEAFGARGGIAQFNRDFLTAAANSSHVTEIVAVPRYMPDPPGPLPPRLDWVTGGVGGKVAYVPALLAAARRRGPFDAVLCGNLRLLPAAWLARRVARHGRALWLVLVAHGIDVWTPPSYLAGRMAGCIDLCLSVSALTRDRMRQWAPIPESRFEIFPNCVDLARFSPGPPPVALARRHGLEGRTVLLTVARLASLERLKGIDQVLEVLPALVKEMPRLTYVIAGEGNDRDRLEAKARDLGLAGHVVFTGYVSEADKPDLYRLADGFVLAGRSEGFGIVLLEAMATGVPVLGSTLDATREVLEDGRLGAVVDPRDPALLRRALAELLHRSKGAVPPELARYAFPEFAARTHAVLARIAAGLG